MVEMRRSLNEKALAKMLKIINSVHKSVQFTHKEEKESKLPFLDVFIRKETEQVNFEIYRKPANTDRVISNTSNHSSQHKMAAFHHMIHRMKSLPFSKYGKRKERQQIFKSSGVKHF